MELPGDDAAGGEFWEIVIHHDDSIELDRDVLAHAADEIVVEFADSHDFGNPVFGGLLHHATEQLPIETAPVVLADIALGPSDGQLVGVGDLAADLHTAVGGFLAQPHLELQFKVLEGPLAAQERIERKAAGRRGTDDGRAFCGPMAGQSAPSCEVVALE